MGGVIPTQYIADPASMRARPPMYQYRTVVCPIRLSNIEYDAITEIVAEMTKELDI